MPLVRRLPKRGFTNIFRKEVGIVNLEQLNTLPQGSEVTLALTQEKGWVASRISYLKILGSGELKQPLSIKAFKVSKSAQAKIEAAGGTVVLTSKPNG